LKNEHRLERNRLKGVAGNAINALLSASAMNFQKLLGVFWGRYFLRTLLDLLPRLRLLTAPNNLTISSSTI
jgi:IS5 family transposase